MSRAALSLWIAVLVAGCAAQGRSTFTWPDEPAPLPESPRHDTWSASLYDLGRLAYKPQELARPVTARRGAVVVTGAADGVVRAFDAGTGRELWTHAMAERIVSEPVVAGDSVLVGSMDGNLVRLDLESGAVEWSYDTEGAILARPAVAGGRVFVANDLNRVIALDAATGKHLWNKQRPHQREFTIFGHGGPLYSGGRLFVGFSDGMLLAVSPEDGATIWSRFLGEKSGDFVDVDTTPVLSNGVLFAAAYRGGLHALDPATGDVKWRHPVEGVSAPAIRGSKLYVTTAARELQALDAADGRLVWRTSFRTGTLSAPEMAGAWILLGTDGGLALVAAADGHARELWTTYDGVSARPTASRGHLFVVSNGGSLHAMEILRR